MMRNIQAPVRRLFTLVVMFAVVALTSTAFAQLSGKGAIRGTVEDKTGAVVPNASVTATNNATNVKTVRQASSAGDYDISPLDDGDYTLTVSAEGFEGYVQEHIHVNVLEVANVNVHLAVGDKGTTVTVTEQPPALETTNATLGATMENDMYSSLPLQMGAFNAPDQRRASDFVYLMPGVQGNETNGNATTNSGVVNGSGSRGAASAIYINGVPFTRAAGEGDPRYVWTAISVDAVDQFQVETNGYPAMYEGQGVQNYNIKSGTNNYHGYIYDFNRNTAFDTWGFFNPGLVNPYTETTPGVTSTGHATKPTEHMNEFGIVLSGPIIKDKLFYFGQYGEFRFTQGPHPVFQTQPTAAMRAGNFTAVGVNIYDPRTTTCNSGATSCIRSQFGPGDPAGASSGANIIPTLLMSTVAQNLQNFIPANTNANLTLNYLAGYKAGLTNWSTTHRVDYTINSKNTASLIVAQGRQASSNPTSQTTAGRNVGPIPINFGQTFAPKTTVIILQDAYTITPHIVNQFSYGFARYNGPTINSDRGGTFGAAANGYGGLPAGQAQDSFPQVTFSGVDAPTTLAGEPASRQIANSYALVDNVQWTKGKHIFTFGAAIAWIQYQNQPDTTGTSPLTIANAVTETENFKGCTGTAPTLTNCQSGPDGVDGIAYASFLTGAPDSVTATNNLLATENGARFRPISPYVQDTWKATSKLTIDAGIRWDYYPPYHEAFNKLSWLDPAGANTLSGNLGVVDFAGTYAGSASCNCTTNINTWYKNFGPRLGIAYAVNSKTVIRASYGVMFTHGNGIGGGANSASGTGTLGFSAAPKITWVNNSNNNYTATVNPVLDDGFPGSPLSSGFLANLNSTVGTGYYLGGPNGGTVGYGDPYLGGRAPEYINWSFGFQREITPTMVVTASYVGSEGHFEQEDSMNGRGPYINQLNPVFLAAGATLGTKATVGNMATAFAATGVAPPNFNQADFDSVNQNVSRALLTFPQYGTVNDTYGNYANSIYHGLQVSLNKRASHGLTYMVNYTYSKSIDDGGTFRSGWDIPAAYNTAHVVLNHTRIERSESTSSQREHLVATGVYALPFGSGRLGGGNRYTRDIFSGFKFSGIFQAYSGSPLALTAASTQCSSNLAEGTCLPTYNPAYTGHGRINGAWGKGVTATNVAVNFIDPNAFDTTAQITSTAAAPLYANAARTAPYKITGPGNYDLDIALRRVFDLGFHHAKFTFDAELYNVTNHTEFGGIGVQVGTSGFGQVSTQVNNWRQAQFSGKLEF